MGNLLGHLGLSSKSRVVTALGVGALAAHLMGYDLMEFPKLTATVGVLGLLAAMLASDSTSEEEFHWGYEKHNGAEVWKEHYEAANGLEQSPIDIDLSKVPGLTNSDRMLSVEQNYKATKGTIINNGHTVTWSLADAGFVTFDDKNWELLQFHFHIPSEHTFCAKQTAIELHFVHKLVDGNELLVIGHCFNVGQDNAFVQQLVSFDEMPMNTEKDFDEVSFESIDFYNNEYVHYAGSLTTPPCSEGVNWFVCKKIHEAGANQVAWFRKCIPFDNYRPVQPMNHRKLCSRCVSDPQMVSA